VHEGALPHAAADRAALAELSDAIDVAGNSLLRRPSDGEALQASVSR